MSAAIEAISSEYYKNIRNQFAWIILRLSVGSVILVAAVLKAEQLMVTMPGFENGLFHARWFNIIVVEFELAFGILLLSGLLQKLAWLISLFLFTGFVGTLFYRAVILQEMTTSCGCFGRVEVPPIYTAVFDIMVIGLLIVFRPKDIVFHWRMFFQELIGLKFNKRFFAAVGIWLMIVTPVTYALFSVQKNDIAGLGTEFIGADGKQTILLEPEKWLDKEFPLLPYIESDKKIDNGLWLVLLYKHTCSSCRECQRLYQDLSKDFSQRNDCPNIAMIEAPPYETNNDFLSENKSFLYGKLAKTQKWRIDSPILILVDDNNVKSHFTNPLNIDLIRAIWSEK
ncbi:MAG: hypothetical protein LBJ67_16985 [Planctomycetaceae bacterium]|jgi:hypothetical protein|nr:hypothetical protein [Planctomycetaceae bacterium]